MNLECDFVKPLKSKDLIDEFEKFIGYTFPISFRNCVVKNNGGYPDKYVFVTKMGCEECIEYFLSFNKEDISTVWDTVDAYNSNIKFAQKNDDYNEEKKLKNIFEKYVVFGEDPGGNEIAFDKADDSVVFIDHETLKVEKIADSFDEFLNCLRDYED